MPNLTLTSPYGAETNKGIKQILKGEGDKLYAWDGGIATAIPDVPTLAKFVSSGYKDTRAPLANFQPSKGGLGGLSSGNTQTQPNAPTVSPSDPLTIFNTNILNMLKQAQGGAGNENLYAQQTALQRAAIGRTTEMTPEELRVLSPAQQEAIRTGKVQALEPEIDAIGAKIKAQDSRLQNFESMLGTIKDIGSEMIKINPAPEIIGGYKNMLIKGGNLASIPAEVRDKVVAQMTDEDWRLNATAGKSSDLPTSVQEYEYAKTNSGYKGTYQQWLDRNRASDGGGEISKDEKAFYADIGDALDKLTTGKYQWGEAFNLIKSKWGAPDDVIDRLLNRDTWAQKGAYEFIQEQRKRSA